MLPAGNPPEYSEITPAVVIRPIAVVPRSVNQRFPSGPGVSEPAIAPGLQLFLNSVICPNGPAPAKPTHAASTSRPSTVKRMSPIAFSSSPAASSRLPRRGRLQRGSRANGDEPPVEAVQDGLARSNAPTLQR